MSHSPAPTVVLRDGNGGSAGATETVYLCFHADTTAMSLLK